MRKFCVAWLLALLVAVPFVNAKKDKSPDAVAPPKLIMIIRHGEKPESGDKTDKDPNLSKRGYQRAEALVHVIPDHFAKPDFLFATHKSAHSDRPIETITPLSKSLKEPIDEVFKDDDYAALAKKLLDDPKYSNKIVLIAWHHGKIPELAHALGATAAPEKWDGKVFDRVWEIKFNDGGASFEDLPQKALPGDSER